MLVPALGAAADGQIVGWGSNAYGQTAFPSSLALPVTQVTGGQLHSVVLLADGSVSCWGSADGRVLAVPAGLSNVVRVAAASEYTLALRRDGTIIGWGGNQDGWCRGTDASGSPRLGDADGQPVQILGQVLSGVSRVAAGRWGPIACTRSGSLVHWGTVTPPPSPITTVTDVASGQGHGLALLADGSVRAWGGWNGNAAGEATVPAGLAGVTRICAGVGSHSIALRSDGTVVCWGSNDYGECLGTTATGGAVLGRPDGRAVTVLGTTLTGVREIAAGFFHTVALRVDGTVVTWGENAGQRSLPAGLSGVRAIGAGMWASYALRGDGTLVGAACEGFESLVQAPSRSNLFTAVASGWDHTLAIRADRTLAAWGDNGNFQCSVPADVSGVLQAAGGFQHSIALLSTGRVRCWGSNMTWGGEFAGQGTDLASLTSVTQVACGDFHNVARRSTGSVVCWGLNEQGRCLGTTSTGAAIGGTPTGQSTKVRGTTLASVVRVAAGADHSMAVHSAGTVSCWGSNVDGWGTVVGQSTPPVSLTGISSLAGAGYHSLALRTDGTVVGWGSNWSGESRGTDASGMPIEGPPDGLPVRIGGVVLSGISQITATGAASLALRSDGTVVAWGDAPAPSPSGLSGVRAIAGGQWHAVALLQDAPSDCAGIGAAGVATLARSGGYWQDIQAWSWTDGGWRVPGSASDVRLRGSVANECAAACATLTVDAGSTLIVTPAASASGSDLAVRVGTRATLGGRLWLLGLASGATELPSDPAWKLPVLSVASSGSLQGTFDLLQTEVPPPAGHFVTLGAEAAADGRTVLSLRVLPLAPGGGALDPRTPGSFNGAAIAAEAIDLDGDLLDDLALAVDFGPSQPGLLQVLMNDGAGRLGGTSVTRSLPSQPTCLAVGDVDGDGRRDIVVGLAGPSGSGSVQVFRDDGQGGLVPGLAISPIAGGPTAVVVIPPAGAGALPGPGWIGVGTSASKMRIYLNGSLQQEVAMAGVVTSARGGRVGAEGTRGRDIATGGTRSSSIEGIAAPETGFVQLLRPLGDGSLGAGPEMLLTARPVGMDFADLDGDGRDDIVTANADPVAAGPGSALPVLSIFRNNDGSFSGGVPFQPSDASAGLSVTLVDADGDGDRDIVSVHATAGGDSEASLLRVDTLGAGTPIAIGQTIDLPATGPTLSARGNLDATAGEDLVLIDGTPSSGLVPQFGVRPYLAPGVSRPADLDGSGTVDFGDVTLAMLDFGPCTGCVADLDRSGTVDFGDVVLILLDFG